jgi:putative DNA primase/helicase
MAFAAPMMRSVDAESGGFGFVNLTSCGKSTCQLAAASVYAKGSDYKESWRATSNGLEALSARHNDALLILDEMGEADPRDVGEMVYMVANETGKARMNKNLTQRPTSRWKTLTLGSGEKSLEQFMATAGHTVKGGQFVRYAEIPADAGKGMGVFETLHDQPSSKALAERVARNSNTYYGTALPAFLTRVAQDKAKADRDIKRLYEEFHQRIEKHTIGTASEVGRVANRFALVAAAGELATMYGVTGWEVGDAFEAAEVCFLAWLSNRVGTGASDIERGIEKIKHFILSEGSRFQGEHGTSSALHLAGYVFGETPMRADEERNVKSWAILPQVFREIVKDFDSDAILKELHRRGVLITNEGRVTHRKKFGGVLQRTYHITAKLFDDGETHMPIPIKASESATAFAA